MLLLNLSLLIDLTFSTPTGDFPNYAAKAETGEDKGVFSWNEIPISEVCVTATGPIWRKPPPRWLKVELLQEPECLLWPNTG
jgi:hypothetical protein